MCPGEYRGLYAMKERILNYNLNLLEKQNKYLVSCITRDQIMATNRLDKFNERLNNAARMSAVLVRNTKHVSANTVSKRSRHVPKPWREKPKPKQEVRDHHISKKIGYLPSQCSPALRKIPKTVRVQMKLW